MFKTLCSKKYAGILWAVGVASVFVGISLLGMQFLHGIPWFLFSSILRLVFGCVILYIVKKIYGRPVQDVLSMKGYKPALAAGSGFFLYFAYYILLWCLGIQSITGLTVGVFLSRILLQQLATGFYEELNYRVLILEGYFHGSKTVQNRLLYAFVSFFLFGAVHVVNGLSIYVFLQTGAIGFAFAVMYLKSGNILLPMLLHFVYDIFANITDYIAWNRSAFFVKLNSAFEIMLIVMFAVSLIMLLRKEKTTSQSAHEWTAA